MAGHAVGHGLVAGPSTADDRHVMVPEEVPNEFEQPGGSELDPKLLELRARMRQAREERGGCPPWPELLADLVPGGAGRPGREERQAHTQVCPYCGEHVREWRASTDYDADRLAAVERGVARGLTQGAHGLLKTLGRALPGRSSDGTPKPARHCVGLPFS